MTRILHLITSIDAGQPWDLLRHTDPRSIAGIVLMPDARTAKPDLAGLTVPTCVLAAEATPGGPAPSFPVIDDETLLAMIWDADTVIVW